MFKAEQRHRTRARTRSSKAAALNSACAEILEPRRLFTGGVGFPNYDPIAVPIQGFQFDYRNAVTTQADGKILIAGYVGTSGVGTGTDIAVVRCNVNGAVDISYGTNGIATVPLPGDQEGKSIAIDATGRAIVAGTTRSGGVFNFAVARFTSTGTADNTFDTDGFASASFSPGQNALAYAVIVQLDGSVIAGGKTFNGTGYDFALAKFTNAGAPDNTFDGDGLRSHSVIPGTSNEITGLALQGNGSIVAVGTTTGPLATPSTFIIARYTPTGANDGTFGSGGSVVANFGAGNVAGAIGVTLQVDGKIVAAGGVTNSTTGVTHMALARYSTTGSVDNSFGGTGKVVVTFGNNDRGEVVAMQNFGGPQKIIVAGSTGSHGSFAVARLNIDGSLDSTFGTGGKSTTAVTYPGSAGIERAPALAIETLTSPTYRNNILVVGVDTSNTPILLSLNGGIMPQPLPNEVWVDDEWTITYDVAPPGFSNGDMLADLSTSTVAIYGLNGFLTIPDAINGVANGGKIHVLGGTDKLFTSAAFTLNNSKIMDVDDNSLIVHNMLVGTWNGSTYTDLTGQIAAGRNTGAWDGIGIITQQPTAVHPETHTLGIASVSDIRNGVGPLDTATWHGQTVTGSDVLIAYTYPGDANLDGKINIDDYLRIDNGIGSGATGWLNGDFNYDGKLNIDDYVLIDSNISSQGPPFNYASAAAPASPPPSAASVFSTTTIPDIVGTAWPASSPSALARGGLLDQDTDDPTLVLS